MKKLLLSLLLTLSLAQPAQAGITDIITKRAPQINYCLDKISKVGHWGIATGGVLITVSSTVQLVSAYKKLKQTVDTNKKDTEPKKTNHVDTSKHSMKCLSSAVGVGSGLLITLVGAYLIKNC